MWDKTLYTYLLIISKHGASLYAQEKESKVKKTMFLIGVRENLTWAEELR